MFLGNEHNDCDEYSCKFSEKTTTTTEAIRITIHSDSYYELRKTKLKSLYTFHVNKNGIETKITESDRKCVVTIYFLKPFLYKENVTVFGN